jgi:amino acid permease
LILGWRAVKIGIPLLVGRTLMNLRPSDETPAERALRRPGFVVVPAVFAIIAVWIAAFSNQGQHRLTGAIAFTLIIVLIVTVGIHFGRCGLRQRRL